MPTMLQNAISGIKRYRRMCEAGHGNMAYLSERINTLWQEILVYRSDETITAYCAKGLFDTDVVYLAMDDIELWASDGDLQRGTDFEVEEIEITGRDFGRRELHEDC